MNADGSNITKSIHLVLWLWKLIHVQVIKIDKLARMGKKSFRDYWCFTMQSLKDSDRG